MSFHCLLNNVWAMVLIAYLFGLSMLMEDSSYYLKIIELILYNLPYVWIMFAPWKLLNKIVMNFLTFMDCAYNAKYVSFMQDYYPCYSLCLSCKNCLCLKLMTPSFLGEISYNSNIAWIKIIFDNMRLNICFTEILS